MKKGTWIFLAISLILAIILVTVLVTNGDDGGRKKPTVPDQKITDVTNPQEIGVKGKVLEPVEQAKGKAAIVFHGIKLGRLKVTVKNLLIDRNLAVTVRVVWFSKDGQRKEQEIKVPNNKPWNPWIEPGMEENLLLTVMPSFSEKYEVQIVGAEKDPSLSGPNLDMIKGIVSGYWNAIIEKEYVDAEKYFYPGLISIIEEIGGMEALIKEGIETDPSFKGHPTKIEMLNATERSSGLIDVFYILSFPDGSSVEKYDVVGRQEDGFWKIERLYN